MPPPLHVCNRLASPADQACRMYCEICEVVSYVAALQWFDVDSNFLACSDPLSMVRFYPKSVRLLVVVITSRNIHRNLFSIREKMPMLAWNIRISGHGENIIAFATHSLAEVSKAMVLGS